jgi:hypothetical protein
VYLPKGPDDSNSDWFTNFEYKNEKWLIGGDFNAHSPLWEKDCILTTSNRLVENVTDSPFCLLNDGSITRIPDIASHRPTAIDLSLLSPSLAINCSWLVSSDPLGSDHLPIVITLNETCETDDKSRDIIPKYNFKFADWNKFYTSLQEDDTNTSECEDVNSLYDTFSKSILKAADLAIPKLSSKKSDKHKGNIWWCKTCEDAVKEKKKNIKSI